jgi:hypothetical protein
LLSSGLDSERSTSSAATVFVVSFDAILAAIIDQQSTLSIERHRTAIRRSKQSSFIDYSAATNVTDRYLIVSSTIE